VPGIIPKPVAEYYHSAVVAHQSGETLAAIFFLRVLIEQWVRPLGPNEKADRCLARYMEQLPTDFKERFPSLPDAYSKLSDSIHSADANGDLYEEVRASIVKHFDARRVFDLGDSIALQVVPSPPSSSDEAQAK
jgi:hypothetical protein